MYLKEQKKLFNITNDSNPNIQLIIIDFDIQYIIYENLYVKTLCKFLFSSKMTKVDNSYLSDSNHDNEEDSEYYDDEYHDDEIDFDNLDPDEPLEEERDTSTILTFYNKRTSKV